MTSRAGCLRLHFIVLTKGALSVGYSPRQTIKSDILPVVGRNPDFKKACGAVKRQLTPKIGQLTNDRREILRIVSFRPTSCIIDPVRRDWLTLICLTDGRNLNNPA